VTRFDDAHILLHRKQPNWCAVGIQFNECDSPHAVSNNHSSIADAGRDADPGILTVILICVGRSGDENVFLVAFDFAFEYVSKRKRWRKHLSANEQNDHCKKQPEPHCQPRVRFVGHRPSPGHPSAQPLWAVTSSSAINPQICGFLGRLALRHGRVGYAAPSAADNAARACLHYYLKPDGRRCRYQSRNLSVDIRICRRSCRKLKGENKQFIRLQGAMGATTPEIR
jgi:hypothetical protein